MKDSPRARLAEVGALAATHGEARLLAMARQKYCGGAVRATESTLLYSLSYKSSYNSPFK